MITRTEAIPHILESVDSLRAALWPHKAAGQKVALIPTMGGLHAGHISLVDIAKSRGDIACATIFINPKQFGSGNDFSNYPRTLENDCALLKAAGCDYLFLPNGEIMYPNGFNTSIHVGGVSEGLCGGNRPGHFDGVATVVTKLLLQALPDYAIFGEKDYQQLQVIKRFVTDLNIPVDIQSGPTWREDNGLAMSSRNQYLTAQEHNIAPRLYDILQCCAHDIKSGKDIETCLISASQQMTDSGFDKTDYIELRTETSLSPITNWHGQKARLLAAAWLGKARLIDNIALG